jgi:nitrate/nitrite transporter NarK
VQALNASTQEVGELFSLTALLGMAAATSGGVIADKIGLKAVVVTSLLMCATGKALHSFTQGCSQWS